MTDLKFAYPVPQNFASQVFQTIIEKNDEAREQLNPDPVDLQRLTESIQKLAHEGEIDNAHLPKELVDVAKDILEESLRDLHLDSEKVDKILYDSLKNKSFLSNLARLLVPVIQEERKKAEFESHFKLPGLR